MSDRPIIEGVDFEATTDGRTVWINGSDGMCIGRLSSRGEIDVHRTMAEQVAGMPQCLDCAHDVPRNEAWDYFVASMARHHGIAVRPELRPNLSDTPRPAPGAREEVGGAN